MDYQKKIWICVS